jgi:vesicle transport through interaction with t-SNAREs 1
MGTWVRDQTVNFAYLTRHNSSSYRIDSIISGSVEVEGELSEAEGYLKAMDIEFRSMASADKKSAQQKVFEYREEYKQMMQNFNTAKTNAESIALRNGPTARTKLLSSNQKLDSSTEMLEQSRKILSQTEKVGTTIMTDLEAQREQLTGAHEKVTETREFTSDAKRILRTMGTRAVMHKICVIITIIILAAVIGVIVYFGFVKKQN